MQASTAISLQSLQQVRPRTEATPAWDVASFSGRFSEISGTESTAALTLAMGLVAQAQRRGEPVAWVSRRESCFYPPDAAAMGIVLSALAVVWIGSPLEAARAADLLLRSGAFGLIVLDLGAEHELPIAAQTRLAALAKRHATALIALTCKEAQQPSIGSLISLRAQADRTGYVQQRFRCEARIIKDKRSGPGWRHAELCHGPDGLR